MTVLSYCTTIVLHAVSLPTQSTGVFRVTYVVPQEAMSLEVRVMLFGKHVGLPYYPVHTVSALSDCAPIMTCVLDGLLCTQCTAMPLELAKTFGQSGDTSSFGVAAGKPGVKLLQPRDIAVAGNATFLCVTDVERHQVIVSSNALPCYYWCNHESYCVCRCTRRQTVVSCGE